VRAGVGATATGRAPRGQARVKTKSTAGLRPAMQSASARPDPHAMTTRPNPTLRDLRPLALALVLLPWRAVPAASLTPEPAPVPHSSRFT